MNLIKEFFTSSFSNAVFYIHSSSQQNQNCPFEWIWTMSNAEIPWELIRNIPLLPLPPGVTQNLDNPESRAYWIYVTVGLCLPIILVFAAIRFYVKLFILKSRTRDDCKLPIEFHRIERDSCLTFEHQTFVSSVWYVPA